MTRLPVAARRHPVDAFLSSETAGGVVLLLATAIALVWANSPGGDSYRVVWHTPLHVGSFHVTAEHAVNDGLMAIFFLLVGLEIKRELLLGELASPRRAALPVAAAVGGMIVPALLFAVLNAAGPGARGWGIPMATDIAFAVGVLNVAGRRVPAAVKLFLLAVAIVDDLGAVLVIAVFYTASISVPALVVAGGVLLVLVGLGRLGVRHVGPYLIVGLGLWAATLASGVHATIAGVLLAFTIPARPGPREGVAANVETPLARLEHALQRPTRFLILPLFALANAGVDVRDGVIPYFRDPVLWGVVVGLLVGKPVGVLLAAWAAVKTGLAVRPADATRGLFAAAAVLCGIGFTMSIFVARLAFPDHPEALAAAKVGILTASLVAGAAGGAMLIRIGKRKA